MKHKVLVVEDEQDTADLLKQVLEREGFSVLQAKDGRQASALIGTVRPPSLVLLAAGAAGLALRRERAKRKRT